MSLTADALGVRVGRVQAPTPLSLALAGRPAAALRVGAPMSYLGWFLLYDAWSGWYVSLNIIPFRSS